MCEPFILTKTGHTVAEHQARTIANYQHLRALGPELPFVRVLQGWEVRDYLRCVERYAGAGIDLTGLPLVALGSVCRRQATGQAEAIITALRAVGITRLHGFGVKTLGLARYGHLLASADSMAWSVAARRSRPLPGCARHRSCANCPRYALAWRQRRLVQLRRSANHGEQLPLFTALDDDTDRNAG